MKVAYRVIKFPFSFAYMCCELWFNVFVRKPTLWGLSFFCADLNAVVQEKREQIKKIKGDVVEPLFVSLKTLVLR